MSPNAQDVPVRTVPNSLGQALAYAYRPGSPDLPTALYLHGYASDMTATKARFLDEACAARNQACLRLDVSGNGRSEGEFSQGTLGQWISDALTVIDAVVGDEFVLVGSSMGGWIGLHCALKRPDRIKAFVGIAAAPDFTERVWLAATDEQRRACETTGWHDEPSGLRLYYNFIQEGRNHMLLGAPINLAMPVTLIQGRRDPDVPWQTAYDLQALITPAHADVVMIEDGEHRLSRPEDLAVLDSVVRQYSGL